MNCITITILVADDELTRWHEWHAKTYEWHKQTFKAWLSTLIGAKARESSEQWDWKHESDQLREVLNGSN